MVKRVLTKTQEKLYAETTESQRANAQRVLAKLGLKRIVTGPTKASVQLTVAEMGAALIGDIEEIDGTWTAVCDTGGTQNSGFRW